MQPFRSGRGLSGRNRNEQSVRSADPALGLQLGDGLAETFVSHSQMLPKDTARHGLLRERSDDLVSEVGVSVLAIGVREGVVEVQMG